MAKISVSCILGLVLTATLPVAAQSQPPEQSQTGSSPASNSNVIEERAVSWKLLVPNLLSDQKHIWLFPAQVATGKHFLPAAAVLGVTAALVAADPPTARYFSKTTSYHRLNRAFSSSATTAGILVIPAAFVLTGVLSKDTYTRNTGLLAAEAAISVEVPSLFLRNTVRRLRPIDVPSHGGNYSDTWFDGGGNPLKAQSSFPSGHTASAFAIATVLARRYPRQRWLPYVAYGLAGAIGFSRVTLNTHFVSDVFFGAALGYSVGRFAVLRE